MDERERYRQMDREKGPCDTCNTDNSICEWDFVHSGEFCCWKCRGQDTHPVAAK